MAKLTDKFFNRVIEGPFEPDSADEAKIIKGLEGQDIKVKKLETSSDAKVAGKLDVTGNANIGGNLVVTGSINGEENPSVKPIYFHPVRFNVSAVIATKTIVFSASLVILNNDSTPFTYATLSKWVYDNDISLVCDATMIDSADGTVFATIINFTKYATSDQRLKVNFLLTNGNVGDGSVAPSEVINFDDSGVNKIN